MPYINAAVNQAERQLDQGVALVAQRQRAYLAPPEAEPNSSCPSAPLDGRRPLFVGAATHGRSFSAVLPAALMREQSGAKQS
jgi:hypothetical protein